MNKLATLALILISSSTFAGTVKFNHQGIQKGTYFESCYHDPCSVAKVINFKKINQTPYITMLELTLVGGSKDRGAKKVQWNHKPHKSFITCSISKPTVQVDDQTTVLPINPKMSVSGILVSDTELYLQACHNFKGSDIDAAIKYGYDVQSDYH